MWLPALFAVALVTGSGSDAGVADHRLQEAHIRPAGQLEIVGELDESLARSALNASEAEVMRCRDRFAPSRAGGCTVRFLVGHDGGVGSAILLPPLLSPALSVPQFEECLLTRIRALRFPAREGIAVVTYSYVLP